MKLQYKNHMTPRASAAEVTKLTISKEAKIRSEKLLMYLQVVMNEKELPYALLVVPRTELKSY